MKINLAIVIIITLLIPFDSLPVIYPKPSPTQFIKFMDFVKLISENGLSGYFQLVSLIVNEIVHLSSISKLFV